MLLGWQGQTKMLRNKGDHWGRREWEEEEEGEGRKGRDREGEGWREAISRRKLQGGSPAGCVDLGYQALWGRFFTPDNGVTEISCPLLLSRPMGRKGTVGHPGASSGCTS